MFLEELERNPSKYIPEVTKEDLSAEVVKVLYLCRHTYTYVDVCALIEMPYAL